MGSRACDNLLGNAACGILEGIRDRDAVIVRCVEEICGTVGVGRNRCQQWAHRIIERERMATTGIGKGVALPHAKVEGLRQPLAGWFIVPEGVDWGALDSRPVYIVVIMLSSLDDIDMHLQMMECVFRCVRREVLRTELLRCNSVSEMKVVLAEAAASEFRNSGGIPGTPYLVWEQMGTRCEPPIITESGVHRRRGEIASRARLTRRPERMGPRRRKGNAPG